MTRISRPPKDLNSFIGRKWLESLTQQANTFDSSTELTYLTFAATPELPNSKRLAGGSDISLVDSGSLLTLRLEDTGVTSGTYTKLTVDSKGRVTTGENATTSDISEGTNLYYTDARARAALSGTTNQINYDSGTGVFSTPQNIHTGATPTFAGLTLTAFTGAVQATAGVLSAGTLTVANGGTGVTSLSNVLGTTNQVSVTNGTARVIGGNVTLSLPQDIHTGASPTFVNATFSGRTSGRVAFYGTSGVMSDDADLLFDGSTLSMPNATSSTTGLLIGGGRLYQDTTTSGSGGTLVNNRAQFRTANLLINAPTHTSTTASEFALQTTKTFTPTADTSGRVWGFNFGVTLTSANNFTDATSAGVGIEGSVTNNSTGTVAALSGGIFFNTLGANSTTSRYAGIDLYGADVSGSGGVGATVTEAIGVLIRMGRSSGNTSVGNITSLFGVQHRGSTWSGTGHLTNQYGMAYSSGGTMNAITANSQVRKYIEVPAMPSPGAFTSTVIYGIDFLGTSRLSRDGIRFAGDVALFSGAANRLDVGTGDSIRSDTSLISPLIRPGNTAAGSTQAIVVRGRDNGDDSTLGGAGTSLTLRGGDGSTGKPTGSGGNLIFRCANGSTTGVMTFYKVDGTTKIQEFDNTGVGWFAATPVAQQTSGANLTNNVTSGGTNDQIDNWTDLSVYATDAAAIRNAVYQLSRKLKQVNDALRTYGLLN